MSKGFVVSIVHQEDLLGIIDLILKTYFVLKSRVSYPNICAHEFELICLGFN